MHAHTRAHTHTRSHARMRMHPPHTRKHVCTRTCFTLQGCSLFLFVPHSCLVLKPCLIVFPARPWLHPDACARAGGSASVGDRWRLHPLPSLHHLAFMRQNLPPPLTLDNLLAVGLVHGQCLQCSRSVRRQCKLGWCLLDLYVTVGRRLDSVFSPHRSSLRHYLQHCSSHPRRFQTLSLMTST